MIEKIVMTDAEEVEWLSDNATLLPLISPSDTVIGHIVSDILLSNSFPDLEINSDVRIYPWWKMKDGREGFFVQCPAASGNSFESGGGWVIDENMVARAMEEFFNEEENRRRFYEVGIQIHSMEFNRGKVIMARTEDLRNRGFDFVDDPVVFPENPGRYVWAIFGYWEEPCVVLVN